METEHRSERISEAEITEAEPEDAKGIQEVFYRTWMDIYPNEEAGITRDDIEFRFKDSFTIEGIRKREEQLRGFLSSPTEKFFIARDKDDIIGVCRVEKRPDENELKAMYVLPEHQGKGVGLKLWSEAEKFFDPEKDTVVHVVTYNTEAIRFYEKLGFKDTGRRWTDEQFRMKSGSVFPEMEMVKKVGATK